MNSKNHEHPKVNIKNVSKSVFITGANKGIGFETAKQLARLGYFVYIGSRDKNKGTEAVKKLKALGLLNVACIQIDVTDLNSIKSARQELETKTQHLDILINNAGIRGNIPQPASQVPVETIRNTFETNFFGVVQTTQQFIDLLKKAKKPIIVNVTSDLASLTNHSDPAWKFYPFKSSAYSPSKTALNAYTVMLAHELKDSNFKVNCVNPGHTATDFNNYRGEKTVEQGAGVIVKYTTLDNTETGKFYSEEGETPW
ncbi:SDR family oxidoreductase [Abyssalbus ytuae]|uniref:SDR family oxidoreductase n=1 Tax=Abyssalbus ytuae TaxID=2926907 RepID=A0A9E7A1T0_9FLAO|nr:SDR family oxidoreductase [Abyssalbus ytuae]UOB18156.1 SDR family oxidoreductase [Abyssalbus ytuae]